MDLNLDFLDRNGQDSELIMLGVKCVVIRACSAASVMQITEDGVTTLVIAATALHALSGPSTPTSGGGS